MVRLRVAGIRHHALQRVSSALHLLGIPEDRSLHEFLSALDSTVALGS
jgi:hypothetical protein